jgi:antitoxin MazE
MRASVVAIGNSRGVRIPKPVLEECKISDEVEMTVTKGRIVLRPVFQKKSRARAGWAEAFSKMAEAGDDQLLIDESIDAPVKDWKW